MAMLTGIVMAMLIMNRCDAHTIVYCDANIMDEKTLKLIGIPLNSIEERIGTL